MHTPWEAVGASRNILSLGLVQGLSLGQASGIARGRSGRCAFRAAHGISRPSGRTRSGRAWSRRWIYPRRSLGCAIASLQRIPNGSDFRKELAQARLARAGLGNHLFQAGQLKSSVAFGLANERGRCRRRLGPPGGRQAGKVLFHLPAGFTREGPPDWPAECPRREEAAGEAERLIKRIAHVHRR